MSDPIDSAINAEHSRQERAWNERMTNKTPSAIDLVERLQKLAHQQADGTDFHKGRQLTAEDTMYWVAADTITRLQAALERIEAGSKLGAEMFERRVKERKGRLTWYAVNVLQDNLDACQGTARAALSSVGGE